MKALYIWFVACLVSLASYSQTIFVVRHGEKAVPDSSGTMMKNDPPLSEAGKKRAEALKEALKNENIAYIFSTNTIRTKSTAEPTRAYFNLTTATYSPMPDSAFVTMIRSLNKNVLIVAHSNTIDDIVNKLCNASKVPGDLPETAYDNLFMLVRKGDQFIFENKKYGTPTP